MAEINCTNKQTDRHYENNGHLAVKNFFFNSGEGHNQDVCSLGAHTQLNRELWTQVDTSKSRSLQSIINKHYHFMTSDRFPVNILHERSQ